MLKPNKYIIFIRLFLPWAKGKFCIVKWERRNDTIIITKALSLQLSLLLPVETEFESTTALASLLTEERILISHLRRMEWSAGAAQPLV